MKRIVAIASCLLGLTACNPELSPPRGIEGESANGPVPQAALRRHAFIIERMAEAGPEHAFLEGEAGFVGPEVLLPLRVRLDARGLHIGNGSSPDVPGARMEVSWVGRSGEVLNASRVPAVSPGVDGNRAEYLRAPGIMEWYVSGPLGLEHGVTLEARPSGEGPLVVHVAMDGMRAVVQGGEVDLVDDAGTHLARMTDLFAIDASGTLVPSRFEAADDGLRYVVDDHRAEYPLVIDPLILSPLNMLQAPAPTADALFGRSVALSGDTAIVGAPGARRAFVYVRSAVEPENWALQDTIQVDVADFGWSVDVDGDTAVVGTRGSRNAYVFVRGAPDPERWSMQGTLAADGEAAGDRFGSSVAISGDTIVVGGPRVDTIGTVIAGRALVFVRSGTTWERQGPALLVDETGFGERVQLDGETALVSGRQRRVHVFVRSGTTWSPQAALETPGDSAASIALHADTAVIGTSNRAYVFVREGVSWRQQGILGEGLTVAALGQAVAVHGNTVVVRAEAFGNFDLRVFRRSGDTWAYQSRTIGGATSTGFGFSLGLESGTVLAGAPSANTMSPTVARAGTAHLYRVLLRDGELGEACSGNEECSSGFCVDGVCCNSACDDVCSTCRAAEGATTDGQCGGGHAGRICRDSTAACDAPEACDGVRTTCPDDVLRPGGFVCRPAAGACDVAEACTGTSASCPTDALVPAGTECNVTEAGCALPGVCNGAAVSCPGGVAPAGVTCRPAVGPCDVAETCDGASALCPTDALASNGTACEDGDGMMCTGVCAAGACTSNPVPGCATDAGMTDAGVPVDGGMPPPGSGGCCRVATGSSQPIGLGVIGFVLAGLLVARRRRR